MFNLTPTQETAYAEIKRRVEKFNALSSRERKALNEQETRLYYILPLFRALGWDTEDAAQMRAEQNIKGKRVDFAFLLNGKPRFLLETKAIAEDLNKPEYIKQARDYAWNKGVTWAVLSDFEGTRVFNAEWKEADPLYAQVLNFSADDYLKRFEELWLLSREAMAAGLLDAKAERDFKKTPRSPITASLFGQLIEARQKLYKDFTAFNASLFNQPRLVDDAVQRMLDRLIFLRTAEDRGIEPESLRAIVRSAPAGKMSATLARHLQTLEATYNSQLFASHATDALFCTDDTLAAVIDGLYLTPSHDAEYNFAAIDADVLGRVYEQYLGYAIGESSQAKSSKVKAKSAVKDSRDTSGEKRAKRKSQGIYYTPTFVVRYIVQQTLGRYLQQNGYNASKPVRVLDPACGSGSFLIEAFDVLDRYLSPDPSPNSRRGGIHDAMRQRRILEENLYGVDKDEQAVEVARLNLMLKALYQREKLPMLKHIARGDSLISGADAELEKYFGVEWESKHAFNWNERFAEAMNAGGFDVVIGNPPYVNVFNLPADDVDFYARRYSTFKNKYDLYGFFIERAVELLPNGGVLGFITSRTWLSLESFIKLRKFLLTSGLILQLALTPSETFADATVQTAIIIFQKESDEQRQISHHIEIVEYDEPSGTFNLQQDVPQREFLAHPQFVFNLSWNPAQNSIFEKLKKGSIELGGIVSFSLGIKTSDNEKFVHTRKMSKHDLPVLRGRDIQRYSHEADTLWLRYVPDEIKKLHGARPRDPNSFFRDEKIVLREISHDVIAAFDTQGYLVLDTANVIFTEKNNPYSLKFILAILNSTLLNWWYHNQFKEGLHVKLNQLSLMPLHAINFSDPAEKRAHDNIVALVERMLKLHKDLQVTNELDAERRAELQERMARTDEEIDDAVFALYGLSEEEIEMVKGNK